MNHEHDTRTCETCKSIHNYSSEQYFRYEAQIDELKRLGNEVANNLENMHGTKNCIRAWREVAGK